MKKRKIILCLTAITLSVFVLLFVVDIFAPRIVNLNSIKENIQLIVLEKTGGTIDYQRIVPSILPRPAVELERVHLKVPGAAEVTVKTVKLYPKIFPLLWGRIVVSKLKAEEPELAVTISSQPYGPPDSKPPYSFAYIRKSFEIILTPLSVRSPDLDIEIQGGRLDINNAMGGALRFRDLNTYLTSTGSTLNMSVSGHSNFSEDITLIGKIDPDTFNVQGRLSLVGFSPDVLMRQMRISDSEFFAGFKSDLSFNFVLFEPKLIIANFTGKAGGSSFSDVNAEIDFSGESPYFYVTKASLELSLKQVHQVLMATGVLGDRLKALKAIDGILEVISARAEGPLFSSSKWDFQLKSEIRSISMSAASLPGNLTLSRGKLDAIPEKLTFEDISANMLDTELHMSGFVSDYFKGVSHIEMTLQGDVGLEVEQWINKSAQIPPLFSVEHPINISRADIKWDSDASLTLDSDLTVAGGPRIALEVMRSPAVLIIKNLRIQDDVSNAVIAFEIGEHELYLKFSGSLYDTTVSSLLPSVQSRGWISGDFEARAPKDDPSQFTAKAKLAGGDFILPRDTGIPLMVNTVSLSADKNVVSIIRSELGVGSKRLIAEGSIASSDKDFILDLHVDTAEITWDDIRQNFLSKKEGPENEKGIESSGSPGIRGKVEVSSGSFEYERFRWEQVHAVVSLRQGETRVDIPEAVICDISTPGSVTVKDAQVHLDFTGEAKKRKLKDSLNCLFGEKVDLNGTFDFRGHVTAQGKAKDLKRSLNGKVRFKARDGTIYRYPLFSRIFSIVNVLEVFKGKYDDIVSKGFTYDSISIKGDIRRGKLVLREAIMDGSTMKIAGEGEVDLKDKETDLTLIVSPLRTIDSIIEQIPIIRDITAGTLISIAMKVTGKIDDPQIITLPPSAVGEGIVGMVRRVFKLPLKLLEPDGHD